MVPWEGLRAAVTAGESMEENSPSTRRDERYERLITIAFIGFGGLLLTAAAYWTATRLGDIGPVLAGAGGRPVSRALLQEFNREILAAFVGAVFFASGALRWRE